MNELLDWNRIHRWALAQEPGSELGTACTNGECPLANYLQAQTGQRWSVGPSIRLTFGSILPDGTASRLQKPLWIDPLIDQIDHIANMLQKPVTREQFLQALEVVKS